MTPDRNLRIKIIIFGRKLIVEAKPTRKAIVGAMNNAADSILLGICI